jgi:hydroxymethylbilane synthase
MRIRIGTRGSKLALAQADIVERHITSIDNAIECEIVVIQTSGDIMYDHNLADIGGKGLFLKELEKALSDRQIDIAVHSLKDVPTTVPEGLVIGAVLERDDPRDVFLSRFGVVIKDLPSGSVIGTSSGRRAEFVKRMRPDLQVVPFRGNINARLDKLARGEVDACVLANAGLKRLSLNHLATQVFRYEEMLPSVGQGIICIELLATNSAIVNIVKELNHTQTHICATAERSFQHAMGGDCTSPLAAYARLEGDLMTLDAMFFSIAHNKMFFATACATPHYDSAKSMGVSCADEMMQQMRSE